ncbi:hypothetical protein GOP47_0016453 [Adiantum capillus-veneris]|uniref:Uncharacterized protein n=1 Tax=Adiantum capillus-veneris TaxID=13818 RepID=A0A9D4ZAA7_ADICA|nr:hypothetical protein GOP47_0016453 [Adiantum capillus-veneris]
MKSLLAMGAGMANMKTWAPTSENSAIFCAITERLRIMSTAYDILLQESKFKGLNILRNMQDEVVLLSHH